MVYYFITVGNKKYILFEYDDGVEVMEVDTFDDMEDTEDMDVDKLDIDDMEVAAALAAGGSQDEIEDVDEMEVAAKAAGGSQDDMGVDDMMVVMVDLLKKAKKARARGGTRRARGGTRRARDAARATAAHPAVAAALAAGGSQDDMELDYEEKLARIQKENLARYASESAEFKSKPLGIMSDDTEFKCSDDLGDLNGKMKILCDAFNSNGIALPNTIGQLKSKFRKLSVEIHPDRGGDAEEFAKVSDAFTSLKKVLNFTGKHKKRSYKKPALKAKRSRRRV